MLLAALAGCAGVAREVLPASGQRLTPDDFRAPNAGEGGGARPIPVYVPERPRAPRVEIRTVTEAEARGGVSGIDTRAGEPVLGVRVESGEGEGGGAIVPPPGQGERAPAPEPLDAGGLTVVDSKVGDLNGKPIMAREWLAPMGARLRAESVGKSREEWRQLAAEEINNELMLELRDELLLAEARSSLTAQEKAGLRTWLRRFEKDVVRSSYGSETLANEQLLQSRGIGLEESKRQQERLALVQTEYKRKIRDRVQVPERDLVREYEKNFERYNPKPKAVFEMIRVSDSDQDTVRAFADMLASGRPFGEVAADDRNQVKDRSEQVREIDGTLGETELFGQADLQAAAAALEPGQMAGPIDTGSLTYWIYLDRIERESHSLYDVQLELRAQLVSEREMEERARYLQRLFVRAGITDEELRQLVVRLVMLAERWYYEGGQG